MIHYSQSKCFTARFCWSFSALRSSGLKACNLHVSFLEKNRFAELDVILPARFEVLLYQLPIRIISNCYGRRVFLLYEPMNLLESFQSIWLSISSAHLSTRLMHKSFHADVVMLPQPHFSNATRFQEDQQCSC